jgi:hypothetical protein
MEDWTVATAGELADLIVSRFREQLKEDEELDE